ncbi:MAG: 30S ribosomal protein S9 [Candidatus Omnitrophica bacterium]|nr:30S ribosomal protein S9 [Candidatus Omnitrophota bacterium]
MSEISKYKGLGRRKESVAQVILQPGKGGIQVNSLDWQQYFKRETDRLLICQPLEQTGNSNKFDIMIKVSGGGISGQAGATRLAIVRALLLAQPDSKTVLKKFGFLTRDSRMKERKKFGRKGARKRFQWTKR